MKKHKNPKIDPICLYCEYVSTVTSENGEEALLCRGKKAVEPDHSCFRFRYDILKRIPDEKPLPLALDPDSILVD